MDTNRNFVIAISLFFISILIGSTMGGISSKKMSSARVRSADDQDGSRGTPTVTVTIAKVQGIDPMEVSGNSNWYYNIGFADSGTSTITWQRFPTTGSATPQNPWLPNSPHTWNPAVGHSVRILIMLCDEDTGADDMADISSDTSQGSGSSVPDPLPTSISSVPYGVYSGVYDLTTNTLSGDTTEVVSSQYKTSGDSDGSTSVDEDDAEVYFTIADNVQAPTVAFEFSPTTPVSGTTVTFSSAGTPSTGASISSYEWSFNDGSSSTQQNPTHVFAYGGAFNVTLTVTDDWGQTGPVSHLITVTQANLPPAAAFSYNPMSPTTSDMIQFSDSSTDSDGTIMTLAWNFGDSTSTEKSPTKKFSTAGNHTVTLMVTDDDGATNSTSQIITIVESSSTDSSCCGVITMVAGAIICLSFLMVGQRKMK